MGQWANGPTGLVRVDDRSRSVGLHVCQGGSTMFRVRTTVVGNPARGMRAPREQRQNHFLRGSRRELRIGSPSLSSPRRRVCEATYYGDGGDVEEKAAGHNRRYRRLPGPDTTCRF